MKRIVVVSSICIMLAACGNQPDVSKTQETPVTPSGKLPFLGEPSIISKNVGGKFVADTIHHTIPAFHFTDQEGQPVTEATVQGKIYVSDFFFTTCPTICPVMKKEMLRVYENFKTEPRLLILSHSIDPEHDNVKVLYDFASRLEVKASKWHFLTGDIDSIYSIADYYMVSAEEAPEAPGGYIHSGSFILVDANRHVRGMYNGTDTKDVDRLMNDISVLLRETD